MSLSPWEMVDLDRLAKDFCHKGKDPAKSAYTKYALDNKWEGTPTWIEGRTFFTEIWRKNRRIYLQLNGGKEDKE